MSDDTDRTPMTRTELAMLWDLCGRWIASHPRDPEGENFAIDEVLDEVDAELAERFGG